MKYYNKEAFKTIMTNLWSPNTGNSFLAALSKPGKKEHIVNNGPWTFGNNILVILSYHDGYLQVSMSFASFWVQIYDLPIDGMNSRAVRKIAEIVGYVEDVDLHDLRPGWDEFVRVLISLGISQQLPRGKRVAMGGSDLLVISKLISSHLYSSGNLHQLENGS